MAAPAALLYNIWRPKSNSAASLKQYGLGKIGGSSICSNPDSIREASGAVVK